MQLAVDARAFFVIAVFRDTFLLQGTSLQNENLICLKKQFTRSERNAGCREQFDILERVLDSRGSSPLTSHTLIGE